MAKSCSMDLRSRLVEAVEAGSSRREAARRFGVSPSCAVKLLARVGAIGSPEPGAAAGGLEAASAGRMKRLWAAG